MNKARYMLDSNICIYLLKGVSEKALQKVEQCSPGELICSVISYAEVVRGVDWRDGQMVSYMEDLFAIVPPQDFDAQAAKCYGRLPFKRHHFDRLIAAHALSQGLTLITNNEADFADIPDLKLENWTA